MAFKFKEVFSGTQAALRADPAQALAAFRAQSRLGDGVDSAVAIRQFSVQVDEPAGLGGRDTAPNPVEYMLAALGSCQEMTYRRYANTLGTPSMVFQFDFPARSTCAASSTSTRACGRATKVSKPKRFWTVRL